MDRRAPRLGADQQVIVREQFARIDSPAPRHAEMEDERIAAIGIDQPVFGPTAQVRHGRARHALAQVDRDRFAQVGAARLDRGQALALQHGLQPAHGGFDFW